MGLFEKLRHELIDIVEWVDDSRHTLVWRFPRYQNEIKNGAQLIVRPGQMAIFVNRGEVADIFEPGHYELTTDNLPILSTLEGWKHGFNSPFKSEVYFISTRQITDLKWGTPNPIMLRDPEFGPIRIRAFGTYSVKAADPKALLEELVGTDKVVDADEVTELLRAIIVSTFTDVIASSKVAALDLASRYREFGEVLRKAVQERIDDEYGLDIPQLFIINISFPEAVEKALDARTSMGVLGDLDRYQQYQMGNAMAAAAANPAGGGASAGLGLGLGMAMAGRMMPGVAPTGMPAPPAPPAWHIADGGNVKGPFSLHQITTGLASGHIAPETLVWTQGMQGWTPASQVPQLNGAMFPPPPPPAP
ncbi:MAG: SPFH domain-containing protein [Planctomycetaceae bacterium]|nr:SPFH domain-containing protein [Planctomycetaceae bacterium]